MIYTRRTELFHHGVKGQKWGVRRYQKKDGSLTPAGKKRYGDADAIQNTDPVTTSKKLRKKVSRGAVAAHSVAAGSLAGLGTWILLGQTNVQASPKLRYIVSVGTMAAVAAMNAKAFANARLVD